MSESMLIYSQTGEQKGSVILPEKIFGLKEKRSVLIHELVVSMMASRRNVVAGTKTKAEVRGGGKKPWQQKGTGRARVGSIRSPLWRGGGITFGPRSNRAFTRKINQKAKRAGILAVLSDRAQNGKIMILENLEISEGKTKELLKALASLRDKVSGIGRKILVVAPTLEQKLVRSARNLPEIRVVAASSLNLLDVLDSDHMIILQESLPLMEKVYLKK